MIAEGCRGGAEGGLLAVTAIISVAQSWVYAARQHQIRRQGYVLRSQPADQHTCKTQHCQLH